MPRKSTIPQNKPDTFSCFRKENGGKSFRRLSPNTPKDPAKSSQNGRQEPGHSPPRRHPPSKSHRPPSYLAGFAALTKKLKTFRIFSPKILTPGSKPGFFPARACRNAL